MFLKRLFAILAVVCIAGGAVAQDKMGGTDKKGAAPKMGAMRDSKGRFIKKGDKMGGGKMAGGKMDGGKMGGGKMAGKMDAKAGGKKPTMRYRDPKTGRFISKDTHDKMMKEKGGAKPDATKKGGKM